MLRNTWPLSFMRRGSSFGGLPPSDDILFYAAAPASNVFDATGLSLGAYQRIILFLDGITVDTADTDVILQYYISGVLQTASYRYGTTYITSGGSTSSETSSSAAHILLNGLVDTGSNIGLSAQVEIDTRLYKRATSRLTRMGDTGDMATSQTAGLLENSGTMTGLKVSGSGGLITGGQAQILAMKVS